MADGLGGNSSPASSAPSASADVRRVGYTAGVFDMFHVGHLNLFRAARELCDYLIVGVTTDDLAEQTKGARPIIPLVERMAIVQSVRHVDHVVPQVSLDKSDAWHALKFDLVFAGDNVQGRPEWQVQERAMQHVGVHVVYLPATYFRSGELLERGLEDLVAD